MAFNFPDYRAMAGAMNSIANPNIPQRLPGIAPEPALEGSGPVPSRSPAMAGPGGGSPGLTATAQAPGSGMPGGGQAQMLMQIVQTLTQMLGRPPSREEVMAVIERMTQGGTPPTMPQPGPTSPITPQTMPVGGAV